MDINFSLEPVSKKARQQKLDEEKSTVEELDMTRARAGVMDG